jgi:hypothetical protein
MAEGSKRRLPIVVTPNKMRENYGPRSGSVLATLVLQKKLAGRHPGLVVGTPAGGSFFHPLADAALRDEVSSRDSPDISSGMPVVPTETKPTL